MSGTECLQHHDICAACQYVCSNHSEHHLPGSSIWTAFCCNLVQWNTQLAPEVRLLFLRQTLSEKCLKPCSSNNVEMMALKNPLERLLSPGA